MNRCSLVLDSINLGIILLDKDLNIKEWNNWMSIYSGISAESAVGKNIFDFYPELKEKSSFIRGTKSVFTFGNMVMLSSKLHNYLFPFEITGTYSTLFGYMQQSCYLIPIKNEIGEVEGLMINVHDVTENAVLEKHLKELSYIDGLTGVYNRRTFEHRLIEEFNRHKREGLPLGLMMFDLDHFKMINDDHGHQFGDIVLQKLVKLCKEKLRAEDFLARFGGEEFVCIFINQDMEQVYTVAERLRAYIENSVISDGKIETKVTISIGIADSNNYTTSCELLKAADDALYLSKQNGRNVISQINN